MRIFKNHIFSVKALTPVRYDASNVIEITSPHYYLNLDLKRGSPRLVIFFGTDFHSLPNSCDKEGFIKKTNDCLDYIRKGCSGLQLIYRPHPAEKNEYSFLNLRGFVISHDRMPGELFLYRNMGGIAHVFSALSGVSVSAYQQGFNSHVFLDLFENSLKESMAFYREYFKSLPSDCFIRDFDQPLTPNKKNLQKDAVIEDAFREIVSISRGDIWWITNDPKMAIPMLGFNKLIKSLDPDRKIRLILIKHRRWDRINLEDISSSFDQIIIFPRLFASLNPIRILKSIVEAYKIKNLPIRRDDIILSSAYFDFIENCFISSFKHNYKVQIMEGIFYDFNYSSDSLERFNDVDFKVTKSSFLYNLILEPLLRLNRTIFMYYKDGKLININRYILPIDELYNKILVLR